MIDSNAPIHLHASEVALRPLTAHDATDLAAAAEGPRAVHPFSFVPAGYPEALDYIQKALREKDAGRRYPFALLWQGVLTGTTSYLDFAYWERPDMPREFPAAVEIGSTWISRPAQRTRCNTEAKHLLLSFAFETWCMERVSQRAFARGHRAAGRVHRGRTARRDARRRRGDSQFRLLLHRRRGMASDQDAAGNTAGRCG